MEKRTFSGLENERYALPARVVDPKRSGGVGGADRVWRDSGVVEIARFAIRRNILS